MTKICDNVEGTLVPLNQLESVQQIHRIVQVCKSKQLFRNINLFIILLQFYDIPQDELAISSLENSVVTRLAVKAVS